MYARLQEDEYMHYVNWRGKRDKGTERIFEEIIAKNFLKMMKDMSLQI